MDGWVDKKISKRKKVRDWNEWKNGVGEWVENK